MACVSLKSGNNQFKIGGSFTEFNPVPLFISLVIVVGLFNLVYADFIKSLRKAYLVWVNVIVYRSQVDQKSTCAETEVLFRELCHTRDLFFGLALVSLIIQVLYFEYYYMFIKINPSNNTPELRILMATTTSLMIILLLVEFYGIAHLAIAVKFTKKLPFIRPHESIDDKLCQVWRYLRCKDAKHKYFNEKLEPYKFYDPDDDCDMKFQSLEDFS